MCKTPYIPAYFNSSACLMSVWQIQFSSMIHSFIKFQSAFKARLQAGNMCNVYHEWTFQTYFYGLLRGLRFKVSVSSLLSDQLQSFHLLLAFRSAWLVQDLFIQLVQDDLFIWLVQDDSFSLLRTCLSNLFRTLTCSAVWLI